MPTVRAGSATARTSRRGPVARLDHPCSLASHASNQRKLSKVEEVQRHALLKLKPNEASSSSDWDAGSRLSGAWTMHLSSRRPDRERIRENHVPSTLLVLGRRSRSLAQRRRPNVGNPPGTVLSLGSCPARQTEQILTRGRLRVNGFPHREQAVLAHLLWQLEQRQPPDFGVKGINTPDSPQSVQRASLARTLDTPFHRCLVALASALIRSSAYWTAARKSGWSQIAAFSTCLRARASALRADRRLRSSSAPSIRFTRRSTFSAGVRRRTPAVDAR